MTELLYDVANLSGQSWTAYRVRDGLLVDANHPSRLELTFMWWKGDRVYAQEKRDRDLMIRDAIIYKLTGWL